MHTFSVAYRRFCTKQIYGIDKSGLCRKCAHTSNPAFRELISLIDIFHERELLATKQSPVMLSFISPLRNLSKRCFKEMHDIRTSRFSCPLV